MIRSVAIVALGVVLAAATATVTVTVKKTAIRSEKQFFAPAVAAATYHQSLAVVKKEGDWYLVDVNGKKGYVHASAVTGGEEKEGSASGFTSLFGGEGKKQSKNEEVAMAGKGLQKHSDEEIALAGKGFNAQVEEKYKDKNPTIDFDKVDRMEKIGVSDGAVVAFMKEGGLTPREGGR